MSFCQSLIATFVGTLTGAIVGAIIAVWAGSRTQRKIEAQKEKSQRLTDLKRLRNHLLAFQREIENNIKFLEIVLHEKPPSTKSLEELVSTTIRDAFISNLGEIPLAETTIAIEFLNHAYKVFDRINRVWKGLYNADIAAMWRKADIERMNRRRVEVVAEHIEKAKGSSREINVLIDKVESKLHLKGS